MPLEVTTVKRRVNYFNIKQASLFLKCVQQGVTLEVTIFEWTLNNFIQNSPAYSWNMYSKCVTL
jgi:hypothetical protein